MGVTRRRTHKVDEIGDRDASSGDEERQKVSSSDEGRLRVKRIRVPIGEADSPKSPQQPVKATEPTTSFCEPRSPSSSFSRGISCDSATQLNVSPSPKLKREAWIRTPTPTTPSSSSFGPQPIPSKSLPPGIKYEIEVTVPPPQNASSTPTEFPKEKTYYCNCDKPAAKFLRRNGRPENIGKVYYVCANRKNAGCRYWHWVDSAEEAGTGDREYRTRVLDEHGVKGPVRNCHCGEPAKLLVSKNGMPHNDGREFLVCSMGRCEFWMWADGTEPFSDEAQERFNAWMDDALAEYAFGDMDDERDYTDYVDDVGDANDLDELDDLSETDDVEEVDDLDELEYLGDDF